MSAQEQFRSIPFEMRDADTEDGRTFEGYAIVFNTPTRIDSYREGTFDEVVRPGSTTRSLAQRMPVLMFEHGQHPLLGSMPLGVITEAREDDHGLFIRARLSDNWLVQPVRDAVKDRAITGMSFRFMVPEGGDRRTKRPGDVDLRELLDFDLPELGPVVFPAYEPTTASVRSLVEQLPQDFTGRPDARSTGGGDPTPSQEAEASTPSLSTLRDDESLRIRGVIHHG